MKKMLEYQKLDIELGKLKKSKLNSVDKANLNKLKSYIVEFQNKGFKLEDNAKELIDNYEKLKEQYNANLEKVQKLTSTSMKDVSIDKVDNILYQINSLSSELFMLDRNINGIQAKIKESLKNFESIKYKIGVAKEKYNECKVKCEKEEETFAPKMKEIESKMKELEKELSPELFAKYKSAKADKAFPVYVPLDNGHCSGCRVELPTAKINKLKTDGTIVCECHRVIYNK